MIFVGIDPGVGGAIAVIRTGEVAGLWEHPYAVEDIPTLLVKGRLEYNTGKMAEIFFNLVEQWSRNDIWVAIERQRAMPRQGVSSTYKTGYGMGLWVGIVEADLLSYTIVEPRVWTTAMVPDGPGKKSAHLERARKLFPAAELHLKKHHGRADALLIAEYARKTWRAK